MTTPFGTVEASVWSECAGILRGTAINKLCRSIDLSSEYSWSVCWLCASARGDMSEWCKFYLDLASYVRCASGAVLLWVASAGDDVCDAELVYVVGVTVAAVDRGHSDFGIEVRGVVYCAVDVDVSADSSGS